MIPNNTQIRPGRRPSLRAATVSVLLALLSTAALQAAGGGDKDKAKDKDKEQYRIVREPALILRGDRHGGPCRIVAMGNGSGYTVLDSSHGYLGAELMSLTPELRRHFGLPDEDAGVMVGKVMEDSPAARAGVEVGDVVTRFDGETVRTSGDLTRAVRRRKTGDTVDLEVWRDGRQVTLSAALEERERCAFDLAPLLGDLKLELGELDDLGVELGGLGLDVSTEVLDGVAVTLREALESGELKDRLRELEKIDLSNLEERMEALRGRLEEVEEELEEQGLHLRDLDPED